MPKWLSSGKKQDKKDRLFTGQASSEAASGTGPIKRASRGGSALQTTVNGDDRAKVNGANYVTWEGTDATGFHSEEEGGSYELSYDSDALVGSSSDPLLPAGVSKLDQSEQDPAARQMANYKKKLEQLFGDKTINEVFEINDNPSSIVTVAPTASTSAAAPASSPPPFLYQGELDTLLGEVSSDGSLESKMNNWGNSNTKSDRIKLRSLSYLLLLKNIHSNFLGAESLEPQQKKNLELQYRAIESPAFVASLQKQEFMSFDGNTVTLQDMLGRKIAHYPKCKESSPAVMAVACGVVLEVPAVGCAQLVIPPVFGLWALCLAYSGGSSLKRTHQKHCLDLAQAVAAAAKAAAKAEAQEAGISADDDLTRDGHRSVDGSASLGAHEDHSLQGGFGSGYEDGDVTKRSNTERTAGGAAEMSAGSASSCQGGGHAGGLEQETRKAAQSMADHNLKVVGENIDNIQAKLKNGEHAIRLSLDIFFERHSDLQRFTALFQAEGLPHGSRNEFINMVCSSHTTRREFLAISTPVAVSGHTEVFSHKATQGGGSSAADSLGLADATSRGGQRSFADGDGIDIEESHSLSSGSRTSEDSSTEQGLNL